MLDIILFVVLVAVGAVIGGIFVSYFESRHIKEMSDAGIRCYAMWNMDGTPMNIYAEECDRREQEAKGESCQS